MSENECVLATYKITYIYIYKNKTSVHKIYFNMKMLQLTFLMSSKMLLFALNAVVRAK